MATRGSGFFTSLMAFLFVAFLVTAVASYTMGWLTVERTPQRTTIEIDTQKVEQAAEEAKQQGTELLENTRESLRESGPAEDGNG